MNHWDGLIAQRWPCGHVKQWDMLRCPLCTAVFKCGHPRTDDNMIVVNGRHLCVTCKRSYAVTNYHRKKNGKMQKEREQ